MGIIDFVRDAGEKLFGRGRAEAALTESKSDPGQRREDQGGERGRR